MIIFLAVYRMDSGGVSSLLVVRGRERGMRLGKPTLIPVVRYGYQYLTSPNITIQVYISAMWIVPARPGRGFLE